MIVSAVSPCVVELRLDCFFPSAVSARSTCRS